MSFERTPEEQRQQDLIDDAHERFYYRHGHSPKDRNWVYNGVHHIGDPLFDVRAESYGYYFEYLRGKRVARIYSTGRIVISKDQKTQRSMFDTLCLREVW